MGANFNKVILVGNLTRDPELRYIPSGTAVAEIGLAINNRHKGANGDWIEETTFVDVTLWARTAEVASEYLSKGSSVLIEGRLKLDTWEKDGKKNSKLRVVGETMQMLGARGGPGGGGSGGNATGGESSRGDSARSDSARGGSTGGGRPRQANNEYSQQAAADVAAAPPDEDIPF